MDKALKEHVKFTEDIINIAEEIRTGLNNDKSPIAILHELEGKDKLSFFVNSPYAHMPKEFINTFNNMIHGLHTDGLKQTAGRLQQRGGMNRVMFALFVGALIAAATAAAWNATTAVTAIGVMIHAALPIGIISLPLSVSVPLLSRAIITHTPPLPRTMTLRLRTLWESFVWATRWQGPTLRDPRVALNPEDTVTTRRTQTGGSSSDTQSKMDMALNKRENFTKDIQNIAEKLRSGLDKPTVALHNLNKAEKEKLILFVNASDTNMPEDLKNTFNNMIRGLHTGGSIQTGGINSIMFILFVGALIACSVAEARNTTAIVTALEAHQSRLEDLIELLIDVWFIADDWLGDETTY